MMGEKSFFNDPFTEATERRNDDLKALNNVASNYFDFGTANAPGT